MKPFLSLSLICALGLGMTLVDGLKAQTPSADTTRFGPYPTNYKQIIMQWLNTQLVDPNSARIEWNGDPKPTDVGNGSEAVSRSEEHTSELQSPYELVCRLLLGKKKLQRT